MSEEDEKEARGDDRRGRERQSMDQNYGYDERREEANRREIDEKNSSGDDNKKNNNKDRENSRENYRENYREDNGEEKRDKDNKNRGSKHNKYIHYPNTPWVVGYVVNVHDALNYDIDLYLPDEIRSRYLNAKHKDERNVVILNKYSYVDVDDNDVNKDRLTYRCRLKGIGLKCHKSYKLQRNAHIEMMRRIDRQNGWVYVTVSDIDIYQRILVNLYDPISKEIYPKS